MSLMDYLQEAFTPMNGVAAEGIIHNESAAMLAYLRGFSCRTADGFDDHLLAVFTPVTLVGLDGR
jgi:hypothetical protein